MTLKWCVRGHHHECTSMRFLPKSTGKILLRDFFAACWGTSPILMKWTIVSRVEAYVEEKNMLILVDFSDRHLHSRLSGRHYH